MSAFGLGALLANGWNGVGSGRRCIRPISSGPLTSTSSWRSAMPSLRLHPLGFVGGFIGWSIAGAHAAASRLPPGHHATCDLRKGGAHPASAY